MALASTHVAADADADRATVVVHAQLEDLIGRQHHAAIAVGIGHTSRVVPRWLSRELRRIYEGCSFPGCHSRYLLHAHHVIAWPQGRPI